MQSADAASDEREAKALSITVKEYKETQEIYKMAANVGWAPIKRYKMTA